MTRASGSGRALAGLMTADLVSTAGTEMTAIALPWFVLVSTGSAAQMGAVLAAEFVGMTVLGLWGGRAATLLGPYRMMLASDLVRAALIALVPILYWTDLLSFPLVLAIGFTIGAFFPGYTSSQRLVLAGLVGDDELRLTRAGGLLGSVNESASFIGPAFGGALVALIGPAAVLMIDAASYLCAFVLVAALVPATSAPADAGAEDTGVVEGLRYLVRHRALRRQVAGIGLVEVGWAALVATLPVLALHDGGAAVAGWLLASFGAGSVIGGLLSSRARTAGGRTTGWAIAGIAASTWLLLLPAPVWAYTGAIAANGVCSGLYFPRFFSALTSSTPPALRARVMTSVTIAISAPGPLGFLGAGVLAQHTGSTTASLLLVSTTTTLGAAFVIRAQRIKPSAQTGAGDLG
ncbi:MAG TPA: MFS transporter [Actinomycetes bacterium]|nr:MFS transporter [Actinomycetes bacterium]